MSNGNRLTGIPTAIASALSPVDEDPISKNIRRTSALASVKALAKSLNDLKNDAYREATAARSANDQSMQERDYVAKDFLDLFQLQISDQDLSVENIKTLENSAYDNIDKLGLDDERFQGSDGQLKRKLLRANINKMSDNAINRKNAVDSIDLLRDQLFNLTKKEQESGLYLKYDSSANSEILNNVKNAADYISKTGLKTDLTAFDKITQAIAKRNYIIDMFRYYDQDDPSRVKGKSYKDEKRGIQFGKNVGTQEKQSVEQAQAAFESGNIEDAYNILLQNLTHRNNDRKILAEELNNRLEKETEVNRTADDNEIGKINKLYGNAKDTQIVKEFGILNLITASTEKGTYSPSITQQKAARDVKLINQFYKLEPSALGTGDPLAFGREVYDQVEALPDEGKNYYFAGRLTPKNNGKDFVWTTEDGNVHYYSKNGKVQENASYGHMMALYKLSETEKNKNLEDISDKMHGWFFQKEGKFSFGTKQKLKKMNPTQTRELVNYLGSIIDFNYTHPENRIEQKRFKKISDDAKKINLEPTFKKAAKESKQIDMVKELRNFLGQGD